MDCTSAVRCSTSSSMLSTGADFYDGLLSREVKDCEMQVLGDHEKSESVADNYVTGTCTCEDSDDQDMFYMPMPSPKMLLSTAVLSRSRPAQATGNLSPIRVPDFECETKQEACSQAASETEGSASELSKIVSVSMVCETAAEDCDEGMAELHGARGQSPIICIEAGVCKQGNIEAAGPQALELKVQLPEPMDTGAMVLDARPPHSMPSRASKRRLVYVVVFLAFIVIFPAVYLHSSRFHNHHDGDNTAATLLNDRTCLRTAMPSTCGCTSYDNSSKPVLALQGVKGAVAGQDTTVLGAAASSVCAVQSLARMRLCDAYEVVPTIQDAGVDAMSGIQDSTVPLATLALICLGQLLAAVLTTLSNAIHGKPTARQTVDKATSPRRDISSFPYIVSGLHTSSPNMPAFYCALLPATYSPSSAASASAARIPAKGPVGFFSLAPSSPTAALSRATHHAIDSGARSSVSRACRTKLPRGASEVHEDVIVKTLRSGRSYEAKVVVPVRK